eukprot:CAMPEP_0168718780 /NCGR_PEP_ID=MMETSP0724-20121128/697_1 /TAXON_ID=265536 /ORGANISM="Amphiprora sp., Strain CCMP467" /LENGTH=616 /DNA_ID=CAMNT_0008765309 /DNA_START=359 /DNA_END=2209 /DNA_ORIENTATION=-
MASTSSTTSKAEDEQKAMLNDGNSNASQVKLHPAASPLPTNSSSSAVNIVNNNDNDNDGEDEGFLDNDETNPRTNNASLTKLVLVAAATAATLGYDVGIMAAAIQPIQAEMQLNNLEKELAMGSLNFVAAAGALLGGVVANKWGRKPTVLLCCWIFVGGTQCMALAPNYMFLLLGRIVTGIGVGVSFVVAPVYLSEVAPTHLRGQLNTVFDVAINGGILAGYIFGFCIQLLPLLSESMKWRLMLGMGLVFPILVLVNLAVLPESPRWLVMANQSEQAGQVLSDLGQTPRQVLRTVSSIEDEAALERRMQQEQQATNATRTTNAPTLGQALDCFAWTWSPGMKLAVALGFWQQITGTEAVLYYSADFLEHAGLESPTQRLLGNCFVGLCKLVPELIAMQTVDKIGRRPHMLLSAVSLMLTTFLLSLSFYFHWPPIYVVILLCAVMASFSLGLGPFTFLVASECLGLTERAWGVTVAAAVNRMTSGTVALTSVSLYEGLGSASFFALYGFIGICSLPFYYTYLPETTGQSLEALAAARNQHVHVHHGDPSHGGAAAQESGLVQLHSPLSATSLNKLSPDSHNNGHLPLPQSSPRSSPTKTTRPAADEYVQMGNSAEMA